ncbi:glyoxalase [Luteibacter pinisoli]|uniref:Glyoxalase n=1 Tax=Luteibacter pinisoli TaxID=2589080 RepID=A0A4Y5YYK8_9GAMM|nr:VOC family protein [Luteibacter pinisoli]QDE37874.1 glyoxalase [Luteibacter pinisoli]
MPSTIIPCLRYRDAKAAIRFLCGAFGFSEHAVYTDDNDISIVVHAQLTYGDGMVMLGSVIPGTEFAEHIVQPDQIGGRETQCPCVTVADIKAHYEHAKAYGATIVEDYEEKEYGGAAYSARDPEGRLWYFGSYDPWATPA